MHKGSPGEPREALTDSYQLPRSELHVPMPYEEVYLGTFNTLLSQVAGEVLDNGDRAVAASGTAYAQGEVRLAFGGVARYEEGEQVAEAGEELSGVFLTEDGVSDGLVVAGEGTQLGVVVGVWEKANVEEHVHVEGRPMLESEGDQADREPVGVGVYEPGEPPL